MSNDIRTRNGLPFNFVDGVAVSGVSVKEELEKNQGIPSVNYYGALADGVSDDADAFNGREIVRVPKGVCLILSNVTAGHAVFDGGVVSVPAGVTVYFESIKSLTHLPVFYGQGTVIIGNRNYDISWFEGNSINEKWDFMIRGFPPENRSWSLYIPRPRLNDPAAIDVAGNGGLMWRTTAPLKLNDPAANASITIDAGFAATPVSGKIEAFFKFSENAKTENITFNSDLRFFGDGKAENGILMTGGAHIRFRNIYASGVDTPVKYYSSNTGYSINDVTGGVIYAAGQTGPIWHLEGDAGGQCQGIHFDQISTDGCSVALPADSYVKVRGIIRNWSVSKGITIYAVTAGLRDVTDSAVIIEATLAGTPMNQSWVGPIYNYSTNVTSKSAVTRNAGGSTKITQVNFEGGGYRPGGQIAFDLSYCQLVTIRAHRVGSIIINSDAEDTFVETVKQTLVTDNGKYTLINGKIRKSYTLADDEAIYIDVPPELQTLCRFTITAKNSTNQHNGDFEISNPTVPPCVLISGGTNIVVATGALTTGTTDGTDGKVNVSATSDGRIYVKNRISVSQQIFVEVR